MLLSRTLERLYQQDETLKFCQHSRLRELAVINFKRAKEEAKAGGFGWATQLLKTALDYRRQARNWEPVPA